MASSYLKSSLGITDETLKKLMKELGVDDVHKEAFSFTMSAGEWANNEKIQSAVKYLGFDARTIVSEFIARATTGANAATAEEEVVTIEGMNVKHGNDLQLDLQFFINLFLTRGNNLAKIKVNTSEKVSEFITRKCANYGIEIDSMKTTGKMAANKLTLARIAQAFSAHTCSIIIATDTPGKLNSRLFSTALPQLLKHTVFSSMVPDDGTEVSRDLNTVAVILNVEMSITLSSPKEKRQKMATNLGEMLEESQGYVNAASSGVTTPNDLKYSVLVKAGVLLMDAKKSVAFSTMMVAVVKQAKQIMKDKSSTYTEAIAALVELRKGE